MRVSTKTSKNKHRREKGTEKISNSNTKYTITSGEVIDGTYSSTLEITQISADLDGEFTCTVTYTGDNAVKLEETFTLHVLCKYRGIVLVP